MRIGIEAQRIFRKKKHGMDIVALELVRQLQRIDNENEYFVFVKEDEDNQVLNETPNVKIIKIKSAPYPYWEQILLPRKAQELGLDILHCTSNTAPVKMSIPLVVTVHDIIYLEKLNLTRGTSYQIAGNLYRRWNVPMVVKRSAGIITVSDFERQRIVSHFGLKEDQVRTVHNGVGEKFKRVTDPGILDDIRKRYHLPGQFMFYLGNTDPKKNMIGVLRALSILKKRKQLTIPLLMLDIDRSFLTRLAEEIGDREILQHISFSGYVPNHDLPAIYSLASVFLYPSLRESFGIPILEAMACGVPVITSSTSSMPEVAGDAALFIDPNNPEQLAEKTVALLNDNTLRQELIEKGLKRSQEFSWEANARNTAKATRRKTLNTQTAIATPDAKI
jgi:glycosyltransferase involved in cell wall biosynthesis